MTGKNTCVTVGVVTHARSESLAQMLNSLVESVNHYQGDCEVIVANNSGEPAFKIVSDILSSSPINRVCSVRVLNSPHNNIAVGRNLIMDNTETDLLLFIDDDEYPDSVWISALVDQYHRSNCAVVAGPIVPVFPKSTPAWIQCIDIHNIGSLKTGDAVPHVATGNCLIDLQVIGDFRFNPDYGLSGGEDTFFFEQLGKSGLQIVWREDARVQEDISQDRCNAKYMIQRFMTQGHTFKRVVLSDKTLFQKALFYAKASIMAPVGVSLGYLLMPFNSWYCARFLKRGYTSLGKLIEVKGSLYG
jgi:succinoglycan biosynthesis protein ExoM